MDNLVSELEELKIQSAGVSDDKLWQICIESVQRAYVPQKTIGTQRPCEEKDFREFRMTVNKNLQDVHTLLQLLQRNSEERGVKIDSASPVVRQFAIHTLLLVGENSEKNLWNNAQSVIIAKDLLRILCGLFEWNNVSHILMGEDNKLEATLLMLRPKLMKDTWKTYPTAVCCYKWLIHQVQEPELARHIGNVLPTALIIFDDFVPENRLIGLECIYQILQHCYMRAELMENGYGDVICEALERLMHEREVRYIIPLYACFTSLLATMEFCYNSGNSFEWTKRDDVILSLLENMECEVNLDLRHAYMMSLPQLLTNVSCAKWCERLTRVLAEYCGNHTDLRTLRATLQASKKILSMFQLRIPAHSPILWTAFLKLHFDLTETPVFDKEITQSLESCICLLYKLTPNIGAAIMRDDRMRSIIKNSVHQACFGDTKYCN